VSTVKVTIERLTVHPHPNADRLELAQVGLYRAVVPRDVYETGSYGLYVPEQAILPDDLIKELGLEGKLAGKDKNRVKAVRLRGEISQGIVCRPAGLTFNGEPVDWNSSWEPELLQGTDFSSDLGIVKWVPPIPPQMAGEAVPGADLIKMGEIENLQRYPDIFADGELVVATEKIHGTCCCITWVVEDQTLLVSSKGLGQNGIALKKSETNLYWRAVRQYGLEEKMRQIADLLDSDKVAVFGEVFGAGVQDLHYGANVRANDSIGFRAFDICDVQNGDKKFIPAFDFAGFCEFFDIPTVPVLYEGLFDLDALRGAASGPSTVGGDHIREGVVIRPWEERHSDVLGGRAIAKLISPEYLTRGGNATEYE
jgi:RNA ligase (TIGR02306 family)